MYKYPYGDSQQLNLDWILAKLKELEEAGLGLDLEDVSKALISLPYNTSSSYRRYDYAFLNGKLYRCLTDTTGTFDPAAWMEVRIGEDIPVLTRLLNADDAAITTLQNQMDSLRPTLLVNSISDLSTSLNRFVTFGSAINMAGITFPQYAKGVLVSQGGSDATLYVISLEGKLYTAFRNNGNWVNGKCINNDISVLNGAINDITPLDTTPTSGSTKGVTSGAVYSAINPTVETIIASNITDGISVTCKKKGNIVRLDCGIASGSKVSFANGTIAFAVLPAGARPPATIYFPIMVRLNGQSAFDSTPRYGTVFTNGNIGINSTGLTDVVQMVFGQTYFV